MQSTQPAGAVRTLALACGVFLSAGMVLASFGPSLPRLAANVGYDVATLGAIFTAFSGGVVLCQFGAGPASDRFGLRRVLACGMLLMSGGIFGVTLVQNIIALLACALLAGLGFGGVLAAGNLLVAGLFPNRSAAALNGANVFFGIGSMLGPALASLTSAQFGAPQAALWAGGGLLVGLAPVVLALAAAPPTAATFGEGSTAEPPRRSVLWLLGLLLLVYTGTEVGFGGWVTIYMMTGASLSPVVAPLVASAFYLAITTGRALGALLGLRLTPQALLVASLLGALGGAVLLLLGVGDLGRSVAGVLLLGLSYGPVFPTALALVAGVSQGNGAAASRALALGNCGGLIIPALLGLSLGRYGPPAVTGIVLVAGLAMLGLCAAILRASGGPAALPRRALPVDAALPACACEE